MTRDVADAEELDLRGKGIVNASGIVGQVVGLRRIKTEACSVQAVTVAQIVWCRIAALEEGKDLWAFSHMGRVNLLYLGRGKRRNAVRGGVLSRGVGAARVVVYVRDGARSEGGKRNRTLYRCLLRNARVQEVDEEKELVVQDRTAYGTAELVLDQLRLRNTGIGVKPVIRRGGVVAMILVDVAVPLVRAAAGDELERVVALRPVGGASAGDPRHHRR